MSAVAATLIRNGRVVTASDDYVADVLMEDGIVRTVREGLAELQHPAELRSPVELRRPDEPGLPTNSTADDLRS